MHTSPSLLAGNLDTGTKFMLGGVMEPIALKKYTNFCEYLALYPEFQCIFIGDNGQGDVRTAEMILDTPKFKGNIERVYMHVVQRLLLTYTMHASTKRDGNASNIFYFKTYIDAAVDAYLHKLIRVSGLRRVMVESVADFGAIPMGSWLIGQANMAAAIMLQELRIREINGSLAAANRVLERDGVSAVPPMLFRRRFLRGAPVRTRMGYGIVEGFRSGDGVYEVVLRYAATGSKRLVVAYMIAAELTLVSSKDAKGLLASIAVPPMKDSRTRLRPSTAIVGAEVWTPYGLGIVLYHRARDDVVAVKSRWGSTMYLQRKLLVKLTEPVSPELPPTPKASLLVNTSSALSPKTASPKQTRPRGNSSLPSLFPQWLTWNRKSLQDFSEGDRVVTCMGLGTVVRVMDRPPSAIAEVALDWELCNGKKAKGFLSVASLKIVDDRGTPRKKKSSASVV